LVLFVVEVVKGSPGGTWYRPKLGTQRSAMCMLLLSAERGITWLIYTAARDVPTRVALHYSTYFFKRISFYFAIFP
jgi:hypothetical protein